MDDPAANANGGWIVDGSTTCAHANSQRLGGDAGGNVYYRCADCDAVVVVEGAAPTDRDAGRPPGEARGDETPLSNLHLEGLERLAGPYGGGRAEGRDEASVLERLRELGGRLRGR